MANFIAVNFLCDNSIDVVPASWLKTSSKCFFPPSNEYKKAINNSEKPQNHWEVYDMKILKCFETLLEAKKYCAEGSGFEDTEDEQQQKKQKLMKRVHPIVTNMTDLNYLIDNSSKTSTDEQAPSEENFEKIEYIYEEEMGQISQSSQNCGDNRVDMEISRLASHSSLNNPVIENKIDQLLNLFEGFSLSFRLLKQDVEQIKSFLLDSQAIETSLSNKMKSKLDFEAFMARLNETRKNHLIKKLKMLGSAPGFHIVQHGKVASIIMELFDKDFYDNKMSWGVKPGVIIQDDMLALSQYPAFFNIVKQALSQEKDGVITTPDDRSLRLSFQNFFKNHAE